MASVSIKHRKSCHFLEKKKNNKKKTPRSDICISSKQLAVADRFEEVTAEQFMGV